VNLQRRKRMGYWDGCQTHAKKLRGDGAGPSRRSDLQLGSSFASANIALSAGCKKYVNVRDELLPLRCEGEQVPTLEQDEARVRDPGVHLLGQRKGAMWSDLPCRMRVGCSISPSRSVQSKVLVASNCALSA
jgi:hypothetical protein